MLARVPSDRRQDLPYSRANNVFENVVLLIILPLLLGGVGGVAVAWLIVQGLWYIALAVVLAIPAAVLLSIYPLLSLFIWFFLMPFFPPGGVHPAVFWVLHRALMVTGLGFNILSRMLRLKKCPPIRWSLAEWSMVAFLVISVASILLTRADLQLYVYGLYDRFFVAFIAYWLIRFSDIKIADVKRLTWVMLVVCVAEIVIGFWAKYAPYTLPALWRFSRMGERMSGTFSNPTPYAYTLIVCMVFIFHYAMHCERKLLKIALLAVFVMGLMCIFLTFTRGCWLAAIVVLLGLLYLYPKTILPLLLVVTPIIAILSSSVLAEEFTFALQRLNTQDTIDSRVVLAHAGEQMFYARPVFGWGFGNYDRYDWQFMERVNDAVPTVWDIRYGTSHNTYLTILAETGVIGFSFLFLPLFWWVKPTIKALPMLPREGIWSRKLLISLWLTALFYLISSQVMDMRFFWLHIGTFWMTWGLIATLAQSIESPALV